MLRSIRSSRARFIESETGAVTVDWVVLTAAVIVLPMLFLGPLFYDIDNAAVAVGNYIRSTP